MKCTSPNQTDELIRYTLQFQFDSLDTWHMYLSGIAYVQDATFIRIKLVFAELWPLDLVKISKNNCLFYIRVAFVNAVLSPLDLAKMAKK